MPILFSLFVTNVNVLLPPSSLLRSKTAWPVVPEPAKKSRMRASGLGWMLIKYLISSIGLGNEKSLLFNIDISSLLPVLVDIFPSLIKLEKLLPLSLEIILYGLFLSTMTFS